jgi:hypothetical protein
LANPRTDNKGLGKRHRHAAESDASNECDDSDEAVEDGEDVVLELEDEDASADNIDTGFSRKRPKNTKSSKSTNNSSKKNKKT